MWKYASVLYIEVGLQAVIVSRPDAKILCLQRLVRFFAYGSSTLVLALFLTELGHSAEKTGLFMTLTLLGDVVISLVLTLFADKLGRRRVLALGALLMTASGIVFALCSQYWILVLASIFGVISPSGNEIGPFRAIEESTISQLVAPIDRSSMLAWYTLFGTVGAALGSVAIGWLVYALQHSYAWSAVESYRTVFWIYAALGIVKFGLCLCLSQETELMTAKKIVKNGPDEQRPLLGENGGQGQTPLATKPKRTHTSTAFLPQLSRHTIGLIFKLCILFAMDSFGSGIASNTWMIYFFNTKFGLEEGKLGSLFFFTYFLASASNLAAASLARKIGLIKTMVFTHLPASIMLALIPVPNNELIAVALLLARSSITSMDTAPRQAFLAAAVLPEERTTVMGIVNVCKTLSQAGGPSVTGKFAGMGKVGFAFIIAGALKGSYDVLMLVMFLSYRTIEEQAEANIETHVETGREEGIERIISAPDR